LIIFAYGAGSMLAFLQNCCYAVYCMCMFKLPTDASDCVNA